MCVCARARACKQWSALSSCVYVYNTEQLLSLAAQEPHKKRPISSKTKKQQQQQQKLKNILEKKKRKKEKEKKGQKEQQEQAAEQDRREVESTNSPEISDRRMTSDISGLPSWRRSRMTWPITHQADKETETDTADLLLGRRRGRCRHHAASCDVSCVCVSPTAPCRGVGASVCPRRTRCVASSRCPSVFFGIKIIVSIAVIAGTPLRPSPPPPPTHTHTRTHTPSPPQPPLPTTNKTHSLCVTACFSLPPLPHCLPPLRACVRAHARARVFVW